MVLTGLFVFIFSLVIYSFGVSSSVFGGDSGDIILSYYFGGIPHPPGYPLNTFLGWILSHIPYLAPSFAFKADYVSAIYQAAAVALLFCLMTKLTKNVFVSLASALTLAFVPLFWLYAHVAEVFQLTSVLILISLIFLFLWLDSAKTKKASFKILYFSSFFFGLAVFHHQTTIFLAPAYLYIIWKRKKFLKKRSKIILNLFLAFFAGILQYLYVFLPVAFFGGTSWYDPTKFKDFVRLIFRADYGTFASAAGLIGFSFKARLVQLLWYFKVVRADFTLVGIFLIVTGGIWLFFKRKEWFWFLALAAFFSGPFFQLYASFPPLESFMQGVSERFFLTSYLFLAIFFGFGLFGIGKSLVGFLSKFGHKQAVAFLVWGSFLLFPMTLVIVNWEKADLSKYKIGDTIAVDILSSADPPGIIFLLGDTITFNSQYSYYIDKVNKDSVIVLTGRIRLPMYRNYFMKQYSNFSYSENFHSTEIFSSQAILIDFVKANYGKIPFYSVDPLPISDEFVWVQQGMLVRLYKKTEAPSGDDLAKIIEEKFNKLTFSKETIANQYTQFFADNLINLYTDFFIRNGNEILNKGKATESEIYFKKALDISDRNTGALFGLGRAYFEAKNCDDAQKTFLKITQIDSNYWQALLGLGNVYRDCFDDKTKSEDYFKKADDVRKKQLDTPVEKL